MAKAPKKGPYIPGVTPTGATGQPRPTDGLLAPGGGGTTPYLPKPPYIPGVTPTGATGQPAIPQAPASPFVPQPGLPAGWGGATASWPPQSTFDAGAWTQSPLMSQYAAQMDPLAGLYGTQQTNALMNQLNVPIPTYGNINWGSPISPASSGGGSTSFPVRNPGASSPPGTLPTTGPGGQLVSPVDYVYGGRPPGGEGLSPGGGSIGSGGGIWNGIRDTAIGALDDVGMVIGGIYGGLPGALLGQAGGQYAQDYLGGGMGTMPTTPIGTPVNPQPVDDGGEFGLMPATPGGVAVNPQPVDDNAWTQEELAAHIADVLARQATPHQGYALVRGAPMMPTSDDFGSQGLAGMPLGVIGGSAQQDSDKEHYWDAWHNRWRSQNS